METTQQTAKLAIRQKILGALLADARTSRRFSAQEIAEVMGITADQYSRYEEGIDSPSLPQLEAAAEILRLKVDHFFQKETLEQTSNDAAAQPRNILLERKKAVARQIQKARTSRGVSIEELASSLNVSIKSLQSVEAGEAELSALQLQDLAAAVGIGIEDFSAAGLSETSASSPTTDQTPAKLSEEAQSDLPAKLFTILAELPKESLRQLSALLSQMAE